MLFAELEEFSSWHAGWYLELSETCQVALDGPQEAAASVRLEQDFDNLRAAFACMSETGDVDLVCRLVIALHEYSFRSMRAELISWADDLRAMPMFDAS